MKYINYKGTYNEQVWDSKTKTVTWNDGRNIKGVTPLNKRRNGWVKLRK